jgi:ankyrin repeat protein
MTQALPANPDLDWLRKTAKQRLIELRSAEPTAKLHQAQFAVANQYGFKSWRALKAHIDRIRPPLGERNRIFAAARAGDVETVRRAFASGFDPATPDQDGRSIHQIAKDLRHDALETLVRNVQGGHRSADEVRDIQTIVVAAQDGDAARLGALLDAHPELINALGGTSFSKATALHLAALRNRHDAIRLLIARGADLNTREFPDNATPLHFAAAHGDLETLRLLVEAGADVEGTGDDHGVGVLGWATCFRDTRTDVATYLLDHGAGLNLWSAIALDRTDDVRAMIARRPALLSTRMTRNQHRRTALHHASFKNRLRMVKLLLDLGADPRVRDATGATALTTATLEGADPRIASALLASGSVPDFVTALGIGDYDEAEAMLRDRPSRIGAYGEDTIALHLAVNKRNLDAIRWLLAHGVDVNAKRLMWDCNHTALHMTVESGALDIARLLLDAGADPDIRDDKYHATAYGWADFFDRPDFAQLFRAKGGEK